MCHSVQSPVISSRLHPHNSLKTLFSDTLSRCPSLPCNLFLVYSYFCFHSHIPPPNGTVGALWYIHKELGGRYILVGIASFVHASGCDCLTQQSSLEPLVTWSGFRHTLHCDCLTDINPNINGFGSIDCNVKRYKAVTKMCNIPTCT